MLVPAAALPSLQTQLLETTAVDITRLPSTDRVPLRSHTGPRFSSFQRHRSDLQPSPEAAAALPLPLPAPSAAASSGPTLVGLFPGVRETSSWFSGVFMSPHLQYMMTAHAQHIFILFFISSPHFFPLSAPFPFTKDPSPFSYSLLPCFFILRFSWSRNHAVLKLMWLIHFT